MVFVGKWESYSDHIYLVRRLRRLMDAVLSIVSRLLLHFCMVWADENICTVRLRSLLPVPRVELFASDELCHPRSGDSFSSNPTEYTHRLDTGYKDTPASMRQDSCIGPNSDWRSSTTYRLVNCNKYKYRMHRCCRLSSKLFLGSHKPMLLFLWVISDYTRLVRSTITWRDITTIA